ncbi:MAG: class I mannose-6-phosphate isomerase [Clostridia bacterium]|nr:class I mannose-6-phosphate isomerase [Clostridia bacterium]
MAKLIKQIETRVVRSYRGGKLIDEFLGKENPSDCFLPEDWISSFVEAKNPDYIPNEGITRVMSDKGERLITNVVSPADFGSGRDVPGVLIKLLDSAERLGIQVHPTPEFSKKHFGTPYGKTECWHILGTREDMDSAVYIGFKEGVTRQIWKDLYQKQDIPKMLDSMHRFEVKPGDTILVTAGSPHAIGAGCFLLEIQEPSDYTMRVEKTTLAGTVLSPWQIHYGAGEENMLDCFIYDGLSREDARKRYFLTPQVTEGENFTHSKLVTYADTTCFKLEKSEGVYEFAPDSFVTLVATSEGSIATAEEEIKVSKGDRVFVPAGSGKITINGSSIICYPPKVQESK